MTKEELISHLQDMEQENLWEAYQVVIRRLLTLVDRPFKMHKLGVAEDDERQFEVVREAWVNMLMHADHFSQFRSAIHVFTDRIEFMNAGSFPIPPEKMYGTMYSSARNPTIAKLFRFAKLSENVGFGISKLMSWKELTGNEVTIRNERDYVLVTLHLKSDVGEFSHNVEDVTERQRIILSLIVDNRRITVSEISIKINVTERTIKRDIAFLQKSGILSREGGRKEGIWKINNYK